MNRQVISYLLIACLLASSISSYDVSAAKKLPHSIKGSSVASVGSISETDASTQRETRNAGYCTRKTVYVTDGITVSEEDCGKKDWWYDIEWGDRISGLSVFIPSRAWFEVHLVGTTLHQQLPNVLSLVVHNGKSPRASRYIN